MGETNDDPRVETGVEGFDGLIGGGIPEGNIVVVSGAAGTGKSLFCMTYAYHGAKNKGENAVYITLEEHPDRMIKNAVKMGFTDLQELVDSKKLAIVRVEVFDVEKLVTNIEDLIDQYGAKRVVIDSVSVLSAFAEKPFMVRKTIFDLANMLKRQDVTAVFTSGISAVSEGHFGVSIEEYTCDGVVTIFHQIAGTRFIRAIGVVKMRGTSHSESLHPLVITDEGFVVLKNSPFPDGFNF